MQLAAGAFGLLVAQRLGWHGKKKLTRNVSEEWGAQSRHLPWRRQSNAQTFGLHAVEVD